MFPADFQILAVMAPFAVAAWSFADFGRRAAAGEEMGNEAALRRWRAGERLRYAKRALRESQDWLRFPVTGISFEDGCSHRPDTFNDVAR